MGKRRQSKKVKAVDPFSTRTLKQSNDEMKIMEKSQRQSQSFSTMLKMKELLESGSSNRQIKRKIKEEMTFRENYSIETKKMKRDSERRKGESYYKHMVRLSEQVNDAIIQAKDATQQEPEKKIMKETKKKNKMKERLQHLKEKRCNKIMQKKIDAEEQERWKDHVKFGEVVMAPPDLKTLPRKAQEFSKPGKRDLLLKKHFKTNSRPSNLSMARKKILDDERQRAIDAYRKIKNHS